MKLGSLSDLTNELSTTQVNARLQKPPQKPGIFNPATEWLQVHRMPFSFGVNYDIVDMYHLSSKRCLIIFTAIKDAKGHYKYSTRKVESPILIINLATMKIIKTLYLPIFSYRALHLRSTDEFIVVSNSNFLSRRFTQRIRTTAPKMYSIYKITFRNKIREKISLDEQCLNNFALVQDQLELVSTGEGLGLLVWDLKQLKASPKDTLNGGYEYGELEYCESAHALVAYLPESYSVQVINWLDKSIAYTFNAAGFTYDEIFHNDGDIINLRKMLLSALGSNKVYVRSHRLDFVAVDLNKACLKLIGCNNLIEWSNDKNLQPTLFTDQSGKELYLSIHPPGSVYVKELLSNKKLFQMKMRAELFDRIFPVMSNQFLVCLGGTQKSKFLSFMGYKS